jgi:fructosamine-3-kinase
MFEGEFESLSALQKTGCIRVPKPIKVLPREGHGALLVMEYLNIQSLGSKADQLGTDLAT